MPGLTESRAIDAAHDLDVSAADLAENLRAMQLEELDEVFVLKKNGLLQDLDIGLRLAQAVKPLEQELAHL